MNNRLTRSIQAGVRQLTQSRLLLAMIFLLPLGTCLFFIDLMHQGLPIKVPSAIVDMDNSPLSRRIIQNLNSSQLIDVAYRLSSPTDAFSLMEQGKVFAIYTIPENFQRDAIGGRKPMITYHCNMSYFIPGTLSYKTLTTSAITTSGTIIKNALTDIGIEDYKANTFLQPITTQEHLIGNPWASYPIYLTNSFAPCMLQLAILLVTVYTLLSEIKHGTSVTWLQQAKGSIIVAIAGKMIPQFIAFSSVGILMQAILWGYNSFPMNGNLLMIILSMLLLVAATQGFGLLIAGAIPNLRIALSIVSLIGVLSFSLGGFSFPVDNMYPSIAIFSNIIPARHYFLIYSDVALNGLDAAWSKWNYISLLLFPIAGTCVIGRLKKHCLTPTYLP